MKHTSTKIITHIVIYVIAIIGIFVLQFKSAKTFSLTLGALSISGRNEVVDGKTIPLLPIQVVSNGISFFVSERDPILVEDTFGQHPILVQDYSNEDARFTIHCSEGVSITFGYDKYGDIEVLSILGNMPDSILSVSIPWKILANARFEIKNKKSLILLSKKSFQFEGDFGFNEMGIIDTHIEQPYLKLTRENPHAQYTSYIESKEFSIQSIAAMSGSTENEYRQAKEEFSSLALNLTREAIAKRNYTEQTLVAYIAEMARRNMYVTAFEHAPASLLTRQNRTALSLSFYGNTIESYNEIIQEENTQRQILSRLISERSISVFEFENLIAYLVDRNSSVLIEDLNAVLAQNDLSKINLSQAIGIIEASLDYAEYFPNRENFFEKNIETCFRKITDSFMIIDENLFGIITENDSSVLDTILNLRLSRVLLRFGTESWKTVGYKLYTSVCSLLGVDGSIAKKYTITAERDSRGIIVNDEVIFNVAQIYPHIVENNWYPSAKSLHKARHGMWLYTSAKEVQVLDSSQNRVHFSIEGIKDASEYFVMRNVSRLRSIIIYGLEYRSDRRFETYNSSGYVYNENTGTLYVKLKHKQDVEEIILLFDN